MRMCGDAGRVVGLTYLGTGEDHGSKRNGILRFINLTRRRLCVLGLEKGSSSAMPLNSAKDFGSLVLERETICQCDCGRRHLISSVVGTMLAATTDNSGTSLAAGATDSQNYLQTLQAIHPKRPDWYEEFFAQNLKSCMQFYEAEVATYKAELFEQLVEHATPKTVLELGIGTGPNLKYYAKTSGIHVIGLDPNKKMEKYARAAALDVGLNETQFEFIHGVGEVIPLPDSSVDSVISTLVLCSVKDVGATLEEVKRVLRPGGTFHFLEHVAAQDGSGLRFWQDVLEPVQELLADGCHLNRDILSNLNAATFQTLTARSISVNKAFLLAPHVIGTAQSAKI